MHSYRYLVQWRSSASGKHHDPFPTEEQARQRLAEVQERECFEYGQIVDMQLQTMDEFRTKHEQFHNTVTVHGN
jgi:hypothetical protein